MIVVGALASLDLRSVWCWVVEKRAESVVAAGAWSDDDPTLRDEVSVAGDGANAVAGGERKPVEAGSNCAQGDPTLNQHVSQVWQQ